MRHILALILSIFTITAINAEILETITLKNGMVLKGYRSQEEPGGPFTFISENTLFKLKDSEYDVTVRSTRDKKQYYNVILSANNFAVVHGVDNNIELQLLDKKDNISNFLHVGNLQFNNLTSKDISLLEFTPYDDNIVEVISVLEDSKMEGYVSTFNTTTNEYSITVDDDIHWIPASKIKERELKRKDEDQPWDALMDRKSTIVLNDKGKARYKKNQLEGYFIGQNFTNGTLTLISPDGISVYDIPFNCIAKKITTPCPKNTKNFTLKSSLENEGLSDHTFFFASSLPNRYMCKVKNGKVVWEYKDPEAKSPILDAVMMDDDVVWIACGDELVAISKDSKKVKTIKANPGQEIDIVRGSKDGMVGYINSGDSLTLTTCSKVKKGPSTKLPHREHNQNKGNQCGGFDFYEDDSYVYSNPESDRIFIIDINNNVPLNKIDIPNVLDVECLSNDNILVTTSNQEVIELRIRGKVAKVIYTLSEEYKQKGAHIKRAHRLKNGNTVITLSYPDETFDSENPPVQGIEIDKEGNIVWQLCAWKSPANLGFPSVIQVLD